MSLQKSLAAMLLLCFPLYAAAQSSLAPQDTLTADDDDLHVAYGTQHPDAVASSLTTLHLDDLKGIVTSWDQAIAGRLPGFNGSYIRGLDTQSGQGTPLIIVDGFRSSLDFISFNEVESISILKDALATSLYGMEASNGVVLITTHRGTPGKRNITIDLDYITSVVHRTADLLNARDYARLRNQAVINDNFYSDPGSFSLPFADPEKYHRPDNPYQYPDNNYLKEIYNPVSGSYKANLKVDGGLKSLRYMFSGQYMGNSGTFNTDLTDKAKASTQNYSNLAIIRGNVDADISRNFTVSTDLKFSLLANNEPATSPVTDALILPPQEFPAFNPDGSLGASVQNPQRNPLGQLGYSGKQTNLKRGVEMNLRARYSLDDLIKGLSLEVRGAMDSWFRLVDRHSTKIPSYIYNPADSSYTLSIDQQDLGVVTWNGAPYNNNQRRTLESSLDYHRTFALKHHLDLMLMSHYDQYDLSYDYYKFMNQGFGMRAAYGFDQKYFAEFSSSYYGQEAFKKGDRYGLFPAAGIAWILSNESFMQPLKNTLNYLKLRASYGMTGGTGFSPADLDRYYSAGIGAGTTSFGFYLNDRIFYNQYFNNSASSWSFGKVGGDVFGVGAGAAMSQVASIVSWDKSYKTDISLQATILDQFNFMFDYFHNTREDFLTQSVTEIPYVTGTFNRVPYNNAGTIVNQGFETSLQFYRKLSELSYSFTANFWYNNAVITHQASINEANPTISYDGQNISQIYGYQTNGFFPVSTPEDSDQGFGKVVPGDVIYVDQDDNGVINVLDQVPLAKPALPKCNFSLGVFLRYKKFFLDAMITGNALGSRYLYGFEIPFSQPYQNAYAYATQSWTPQTASSASFPRLSNASNTNNSQISDLWIRSTDRIDLRYVQLGYDLTLRQTKKENTQAAIRLFIQALNPISLLRYDDRAYTAAPWYKHYSAGMNLKF